MSIDEIDGEIDKEEIFRFGENREKERVLLIEELKKVQKQIKHIEYKERILFDKKMMLDNQKERLEEQLKSMSHGIKLPSKQKIYHFNREELIIILDDFIQYKDYFENPPKEAYEMDDWDYTLCREAKEVERLLYKYEIYDPQYREKLPIMESMYNKKTPSEFSREKLKLDEILAVLTWIHRGERWCGGFFNEAIEEKTFYHLLKRMEEIRNEL